MGVGRYSGARIVSFGHQLSKHLEVVTNICFVRLTPLHGCPMKRIGAPVGFFLFNKINITEDDWYINREDLHYTTHEGFIGGVDWIEGYAEVLRNRIADNSG